MRACALGDIWAGRQADKQVKSSYGAFDLDNNESRCISGCIKYIDIDRPSKHTINRNDKDNSLFNSYYDK